jgi:aromatic ring-cleaving dioxygenase
MAAEPPITGPTGAITGYHAHVYYDEASRAEAAALREAVDAQFKVALGRWRDMPVGPHPQAMYQVAFGVEEFPRLVPWFMLNRGSLVVLVHPLTDDEYEDHAHHALWLGAKLPLNLAVLRHGPTEPANR